MKKTIFIAILMIFTLGISTTFAENKNPKSKTEVTTEQKLSSEEITRLTNRVKEIYNMDKSKMTFTEKRELRKEVKEIKKTMKADGVVIYLSSAAIVIIILLIILL